VDTCGAYGRPYRDKAAAQDKALIPLPHGQALFSVCPFPETAEGLVSGDVIPFIKWRDMPRRLKHVFWP
jgi:hypothetical protein